MLANRALIGGLLALAAAIVLRGIDSDGDGGLGLTVFLVVTAAALWTVGALLFALIHEQSGATEDGRSMLTELRGGIALVCAIHGFRRYLFVRALLLAVELAMPIFVLQANALGATGTGDLPVYVFAVSLAAVISSPFWGRFSDTASECVMALSGLIGGIAAVGMIALPRLFPDTASAWTLAVFFALLGIAESGIRLGRKTYLVDGAPVDERPLYTAFSNTAIGTLAFAGVGLGLLADFVAPDAALAAITVLGIAGALAARSLPPAEQMSDHGTT
jgi:MFS family permease